MTDLHDEDNRPENLENEFELRVETPAVQEKPKSTKRKINLISEDQIQSAISAVSSGQMSFHGAARKFGISRQRLARIFQQGFYKRRIIKSDEASKTIFESSQAPPQSLDAFDETLHVCDLCGFETLIKINLTHHMTSHSDGQDITKVTCSLCQKVFLTRHIKMMHERNHCKTSKGEFSCEKCGMNFTTKLHMINHHNADHGNFSCKNCDKVFFLKIDLNVHSKTHGKVKRKKHRQTSDVEPETVKKAETIKTCKYCSVQIRSNQDLRKHVSRLHPI